MQILSSLLFGISASLDTLLIGFSYGIRRIHIPFWQNFLIGFITLCGSFLSMALGNLLEPFLPTPIVSYAGSVLLILFGCYYLIKYLYQKRQCSTHMASEDTSPNPMSPSFMEVVMLGIMLSVNNIGIGFGTGMSGLLLAPTMISIFFFSIIFMTLGNRMGELKLFTLTESMADVISGILLICLGMSLFIL